MRIILASVLMALAAISPAETQIRNELLPINQVLLSQKGEKVKILSSNGRFEFIGTLVDRWAKKAIQNADDAHRAFHFLDFAGIDFNVGKLEPYYLGEGPTTIIFVDPLCPYCKQLLAELPAHLDKHRFAVVPVGIMSPDSIKIANDLSCAEDQKAARAQLMLGEYAPLHQRSGCDNEVQAIRLVTTQLFAIRQVPFLLRSDGLIQRGMPQAGLAAWLEE